MSVLMFRIVVYYLVVPGKYWNGFEVTLNWFGGYLDDFEFIG